jgi:hypothetical protein
MNVGDVVPPSRSRPECDNCGSTSFWTTSAKSDTPANLDWFCVACMECGEPHLELTMKLGEF